MPSCASRRTPCDSSPTSQNGTAWRRGMVTNSRTRKPSGSRAYRAMAGWARVPGSPPRRKGLAQLGLIVLLFVFILSLSLDYFYHPEPCPASLGYR